MPFLLQRLLDFVRSNRTSRKKQKRQESTTRPRASKSLRVDPLEERILLAGDLPTTTEHFEPIYENAPGVNPFGPLKPDALHPPGGSPNGFQFNDTNRWGTTATDGGGLSQGDATTLRWSFLRDGVNIPGFNGEAASNSSLIAFLGGIYGVTTNNLIFTDEPWFPLFQSYLNRWGEVSGLSYVYEPNDDGANFVNAAGVVGTRGDIRIGGHFIDGQAGSNTLAYNFFPNTGDMVIDTGNTTFYGNQANNSINLRNVLSHEHGHGLGVSHVCPVIGGADGRLMEPFINVNFDGPQFDDILAVQRGYGDALEKGTGNDTFGNATSLGTLSPGTPIERGTDADDNRVVPADTDFVSIDDNSDIDFYSVIVPNGVTLSIDLTPKGPTYLSGPQNGDGSCSAGTSFNSSAQSDLTLALLDTNGTTVLSTANANGLGGSESITSNVLSAGTYYVRITGAQNTIQMYELSVDGVFGIDYGDAPDAPYPTLQASNGARHTTTGPRLGATIDAEPNGQPNATATGDGADEDGVQFTNALVAGTTVNVQVNASAVGVLDYFFDFDGAGGFGNNANEVFSANLTAGTQNVPVTIPIGATANTFARFRISTAGGLGPSGAAANGEVEDYAVTIAPPVLDYGDAPAPYPTTIAEGGPVHSAFGPTLGAQRDGEPDGVHSTAANADDTTGSPDDEDGVEFDAMRVGQLAAFATVNVQGGPAKLDAWIDFNGDGAWGGPGEQIADSLDVIVGDNAVRFDVPSTAIAGTTIARFRLSTAGGLGVGGSAADGEVEDHQVTILSPVTTAGAFGSQNNITTSADGAISVQTADVDGDGDMDVLSASFTDDKIAWYENDGSQNFTERVISNNADRATSIQVADVDGDGDLDVLSASALDDKIAWYENNGSQNFTERVVSTNADEAYSVQVADMDGDGDLDVLSASKNDDKIAWYENNGSQNFTERVISTAANGAISVQTADVDGDGDMDVLSASIFDDKIAWYENNGSQNFTERVISTNADRATSVQVADVDGDGDLDVLSASSLDDKIAWYENNGSQNFTERVISTGADFAYSVQVADVDGDGDLDVLSASRDDDKIAWYENDGSQSFTERVIVTAADSARNVQVADVDGDGDLDVLSASFNDDKIAWYENIDDRDFGDAPDTFGTTIAASGAHHWATGPFMGVLRDVELDGQPTNDATGDDAANANLVNVEFVLSLETITGSPFGLTSAADRTKLATGSFQYDASTTDTNATNARGHYPHTANGGFSLTLPNGTVITGSATPYLEVEDIGNIDTFRFLDGNDGGGGNPTDANMLVNGTADPNTNVFIAISENPGPFNNDDLPTTFPWQTSPFPTHTFRLRDSNGTILFQFKDNVQQQVVDDEDGVTLPAANLGHAGNTATVFVSNAPSGAKLDAWVDFNNDGSFGAGEQIVTNQTVNNGNNNVNYTVPATAAVGTLMSRFRLSSAGGLGPTGEAFDGEIEDHSLTVNAISLSGRKFDDRDADGTDNSGADPGVDGVRIELYRDGGDGQFGSDGQGADAGTGNNGDDDVYVGFQLTSGGGNYTFPNVATGRHFVREVVPNGWMASTATFSTFVGAPGVNVTGQDFGNLVRGSIRGFKFEDLNANGTYEAGTDAPMQGITFTLTGTDGKGNVINTNTTSDANGLFEFTNLLPSVAASAAGTGYTVTETIPANQAATTPIVFTTDLFSRQDLVAVAGQANIPKPNLVLDTNFGTGGRAQSSNLTTSYRAVATQADGKVVSAGLVNGGQQFIVSRYHTSGVLDTSFGSGGEVVTDLTGIHDYPRAIAVQSDGKIVLGGQANGSQGLVVRFNTDGTLDTTFGTGGSITLSNSVDVVRDISLQTDGKIVFAARQNSDAVVGRLNTNGSLDATFGSLGIALADFGNTEEGRALAIQSDGKVVLVSSENNGPVLVARYNADGTPDATFGTAGKVSTTVSGNFSRARDVLIQPDGKIVVGGRTIDSTNDFVVIRYNADGSLDTTFGTGGIAIHQPGSDVESRTLGILSDGRIVLAGRVSGFVVLDSSGSVDQSDFSTSQVVRPYNLFVQSDNSVFITGERIVEKYLNSVSPRTEVLVGAPLMFGNVRTDFGDAPNTFGTTLASNGARHIAVGPSLGNTRDGEDDAQTPLDGTGDGADEDGVTFAPTTPGQANASATVNVRGSAAKLDAWVDFNNNGVFDATERIANSTNVAVGDNTVNFAVPGGAVVGQPLFTRFRLSTAGGLAPTGPAADGEVEDHTMLIAPLVTLNIDNDPIVENGGVATVTATLSSVSVTNVTVNLATSGTATAGGTDYNLSSTQIVIPAGSLSRTATITAVDDALDEFDETAIVDIASTTNGHENGVQQVSTTITDDDPLPTVNLSVNNANIVENGGVATVTATLSVLSGRDVTVDLAATGTATGGGTDYNLSATQIVISAGSLTGTATVTAVDDALDEIDETVIVDISNVTNATENGTQQITTTITDDDPAPLVTLSVDNSTIAENGGVATFTATLSTVSTKDVTVNLATSGTATNATDYNLSTTQIVISAGSLSGTATVTASDDPTDEVDETVVVDISTITNGTEDGTQQQSTTITDDDLPPTVTLGVNNAAIAENGGVATVTATLSTISAKDVTVQLGYTGTATGSGTDYNSSSSSIFIAAGNLTGTATVTAVQDPIDENDETVIVDITSVTNGTESGTQQVTTTITDDDPLPLVSLAVNQANISENNGVATVTATLDAVSGRDVTIDLALSGTATNVADYNASATQIVIAAGSLTGTATITASQDLVDEVAESVIVDIASVNNGTENGTQQVTTNIVDDDLPPLVSIAVDTATIAESGGVATVTATLSTVSSLQVTVDLGISGTATSGSDFGISATQIVIAPGNLTGTSVITSTHDDVDENNETVVVDVTGVTNGTESGIQQAITTILDDDTAGLTIVPTGTTSVNESGTTDTFTVVLNSQPLTDVVISVTSSDNGEATVDQPTLTFTTANWNQAQTVTVTGVDEPLVDGDQTSTVTLSIVDGSSDVTFHAVADASVSVTTVDNDGPSFSTNESGATVVNEVGPADSFDVVLDRQPLSQVTITVTSNDLTEAIVDKSTLVFTNATWNQPQTVTVTGVDEFLADGNQTTQVRLSIDDDNSDAAFRPLADKNVNVTTIDNDVPGFSLVESNGTTSVTETRTSDTIGVVLNAQPLADVVIDITNPDTSEVSINQTSFQFTPFNWNVQQTLVISGVDDAFIDGDQTTGLVFSVRDSASDNAFDPLPDQTVNVTTVDNDLADIRIIETGGSTIMSESTSTDKINVVLTGQPQSNVVLQISSGDLTEATVDKNTLTFTPQNWDSIQTVTVTSVDDDFVDGDQTTAITISVIDGSSDDSFDSIADKTVNATTRDDDVANFAISQSDGTTIVGEDGTSDTFLVVLTGRPVNDVVIDVATSNAAEVTTNPTSLTFTTNDWNTPQIVTVNGIDDPAIDGDQQATLTLSINDQASDDSFDSLADQTVAVTNRDNDQPGFTITESNGSTQTSENGTTDTFDVVLNAQPNSNVVIRLRSNDLGEARVGTSTLTFTAQNWNTPQIVNVVGSDDLIVDGSQAAAILLSVDNLLSDGQFGGVGARIVVAENSDNEVPSIVVSQTGGSTNVNERGARDTFDVTLNSPPLGRVVVSVISGDTTEATVNKSTLIFTPFDWNVPQTVEVTGVDDSISDGSKQTNITLAVIDAASHIAFRSAADQTVTVTTVDDETAVVNFGFWRNDTARFYQDFNNNGTFDNVRPLGAAGDRPLVGDFDGDGDDDIAVHRTATGLLAIDYDSNGTLDKLIFVGAPGLDEVHVGYFDNDAKADLLIYRASQGQVFVDLGADGSIDRLFNFGAPNLDRVIIADIDGDSRDDLVLHRPSQARAFVDLGVDGTLDQIIRLGAENIDQFLSGDFDGDGRADLLVHRASAGRIFIDLNSDSTIDRAFNLGGPNDRIVVADLDGDGKDDLLVHRPGSGRVFFDLGANGTIDRVFAVGAQNDFAIVGRWANPLIADEGEKEPTPATSTVTDEQLAPVVDAAVDIYAGAGLTAAQLTKLRSTTFVVDDLQGARLGAAGGSTIIIDSNAAGHGWFVDSTPHRDEEFVNFGDDGLTALAASAAAGQIDLLTVVLHELGHVLGLGHSSSPLDVMHETLATGIRRRL